MSITIHHLKNQVSLLILPLLTMPPLRPFMALSITLQTLALANDSEKRLSLMDSLLDYAPNWKLGHVDTELRALRRSFEIDASDLYAVLTQDVARAFECIFLFDTATRTINAYKVENVGKDTCIYLSIHNLVRSKTIAPSSDTIYTSFSVLADDNQDILSFLDKKVSSSLHHKRH